MHYETTGRAPGLKFDPFKALAVPRPIGWIATLGPDGVPNRTKTSPSEAGR